MLNVWCVLWGKKYGPERVQALARMVNRHLDQPYQFLCLTDQRVDGVACVAPVENWEGWWQKISLFSPILRRSDRNLYLDLDVIVRGPLSPYTAPTGLHMQRNWAKSGHGGWQSSMMLWRDCPATQVIWDNFRYEVDSAAFYGDQEYITAIAGGQIQEFEPAAICSYKYHCRQQQLPNVPVVAFHGFPNYWEVNEPWITAALS